MIIKTHAAERQQRPPIHPPATHLPFRRFPSPPPRPPVTFDQDLPPRTTVHPVSRGGGGGGGGVGNGYRALPLPTAPPPICSSSRQRSRHRHINYVNVSPMLIWHLLVIVVVVLLSSSLYENPLSFSWTCMLQDEFFFLFSHLHRFFFSTFLFTITIIIASVYLFIIIFIIIILIGFFSSQAVVSPTPIDLHSIIL